LVPELVAASADPASGWQERAFRRALALEVRKEERLGNQLVRQAPALAVRKEERLENQLVRQAPALAVRKEERPANQLVHQGRREYGRSARPDNRVPVARQAVWLAPVDGPGWWLRPPQQQPLQRP
jgi:hypothetical protein